MIYAKMVTKLGDLTVPSHATVPFNYLLTYDSFVPLYNRFHRGEWITRVSGGEGALDTPGPLNGIWAQEWAHKNQWSIGSFM